MGYFILTTRSLTWMLVSLLSALMMFSALLNPSWLTTRPQSVTIGNETVTFTPSVGLYAKCGKPISINHSACTIIPLRGLATSSEIFPTIWKIAMVFLCMGKFNKFFYAVELKFNVLGLTIMSVTVLNSLISCCYQSIFRKSIFTLSGMAQAVAGKKLIRTVLRKIV